MGADIGFRLMMIVDLNTKNTFVLIKFQNR